MNQIAMKETTMNPQPSGARRHLPHQVRHAGQAGRAALAGLFALAFAWATPALADYPERPIRVIVPVATGGGTDIVARLVGKKLSESFGQPVVVENRPGAGGNIGAVQVARAQPDGYTLLLTYGANITVNPKVYKNAGFDPTKDFAPVTEIASAPYLLVVNPNVPVTSVAQLIQLMKQKKENFSFSSAAQGSPDHLAGEMFKMMTGVEMLNIPYKGGAEGLIDVMGGRVQMSFVTIPTAINHVKNNALRPLGVSEPRRSALLPDVPPISDAVPGFEIGTWYGLWAPAGTPPAIVNRLQSEIKRIVAMEDVAAFFAKSGFVARATTPAEFAQFNKKETDKYGAIVNAANVKLD